MSDLFFCYRGTLELMWWQTLLIAFLVIWLQRMRLISLIPQARHLGRILVAIKDLTVGVACTITMSNQILNMCNTPCISTNYRRIREELHKRTMNWSNGKVYLRVWVLAMTRVLQEFIKLSYGHSLCYCSTICWMNQMIYAHN